MSTQFVACSFSSFIFTRYNNSFCYNVSILQLWEQAAMNSFMPVSWCACSRIYLEYRYTWSRYTWRCNCWIVKYEISTLQVTKLCSKVVVPVSLSCSIYEFVTPFKFRSGHLILIVLCVTLALIHKWLQFSLWVWVVLTPTSGSCQSNYVALKARGSTMIICLIGLNHISYKSPPSWDLLTFCGLPRNVGWKEVSVFLLLTWY